MQIPQTQLRPYKSEPTPRKFHRDIDSRVKGIMGPYGCLSAETQYLTPTGWKRMDQYTPGDLVAQWHEMGDIEFVQPEAYVVEPCEEFWHFHNAHSLSMQLSDEHKIVFYDWNDQLKTKTAEAVADKIISNAEGPALWVPVTFWQDRNAPGIELSENELRLMVAVIADGNFNPYYKDHEIPRCTVTLRKARKIERLRELLRACEIAYSEKYSPKRPTEARFTFMSPWLLKEFDERFWGCTQSQLEIIYDEFPKWDGSTSGDQRLFDSTSLMSAEFIQFVCCATGHRATLNKLKNPEGKGWKQVYRVNATQRHGERVSFRAAKVARVPSEDGKKYCFTVPSGMFVARHDNRVFITGNSGKSSACVMECLYMMMGQHAVGNVRRSVGCVVRNTFSELRSTTIKTWEYWLPSHMCQIVYGSPIEGRIRIGAYDNSIIESTVYFLPLDRPKDIGRVLSLELTWAWVNEAKQVPWILIDELRKRMPRYPHPDMGGAHRWGLIMDTNPPPMHHWYYDFAEVVKPEGWNFYRQPGGLIKTPSGIYIPNPAAENIEHLNGRYSYYVEMLNGADPHTIAVNVLGEYGNVFEGMPVYEGLWSDGLFIPPEPIEPMRGLPLFLGWDFGLTPCCIVGQLTPKGTLNILKEFQCEDGGVRQHVERTVLPALHHFYHGLRVAGSFGDPAGLQRNQANALAPDCFAELNDVGLPATPAATNDFVTRRAAVINWMTRMSGERPALQIDGSCRLLIEGFQGAYHFKQMQISGVMARYNERPDKNYVSHAHDALQYLCMGLDPRFHRPSRLPYKPTRRRTLAGMLAG